jgi:hypothetical protein
MSTPDLSPLLAGELVCHKCGKKMTMKVVMGARAVTCIEYMCKNPKSGCSYKVQSFAMASMEMVGVRPDETEVRP